MNRQAQNGDREARLARIRAAGAARIARHGVSGTTPVAADAGLTDAALHGCVRDDDELVQLAFAGTSAHEAPVARPATALDGPG